MQHMRVGREGVSRGGMWGVVTPFLQYEFKQPFESPIEACTSFYIGILAQKVTW
jgi:hypothetical protein